MTIDPNEPIHGTHGVGGLTIRAEIASRIMVGLAASRDISPRSAVYWADALIIELNKSDEPKAKNT
jgi:hypothetical protein|tara:strand:- start:806 stop:1003 length:198 start_codon:yes stop_codon:yes gene_type:complete